ncbi:hypothetical protein [Ktedonobacter racemifer]|nr:hypothetical protein [Ktedonobacter racemifer]
MMNTYVEQPEAVAGKTRRVVGRVAYISAGLWIVRLLAFFVPALRDASPSGAPLLSELFCVLGIATHMTLLPVVDALPGPRWGKAAGYGWIAIDMATEIMQLNGVPHATYIALKYGGHISAAVWFATASWRQKGTMRVVGLLLALVLGGYSFVAPFDPTHFIGLLPSLVLIPTWIILAGREITRERRVKADVAVE